MEYKHNARIIRRTPKIAGKIFLLRENAFCI
jgi:hypothetical protein